MKTLNNTKKSLMALLLISPVFASAEGQILNGNTYFSNALFNTLLAVVIFLVIVIVSLGKVLKNLADSDFITKSKNENDNKGKTVKTAGIVLLALIGFEASAQTNNSWQVGGLDSFTFYFLISVVVLEVIIIVSLLTTIKYLLKKESAAAALQSAKKEKSILEKINASVAVEEEEQIMTDHVYDGIRELDNDLPPWWRYGFYLTILIAVVYLIHYHIAGTGDLQLEEYNKEVAEGKAQVEAYMKLSASNVDETTVKMLSGADLEAGKTVFNTNCAACHGKAGEGTVGPNLTDDYWLHQGSLSDIFKSIKYGWPDKGMKAWKEDFSPVQIAQLTSYIKSLKGTNPPNAKAPQGDLFNEGGMPPDSLNASSDSTKVTALK